MLFNISASQIFANLFRGFSAIFFFGGGGAHSSNYCLRVTAERTNQIAQRPFFNAEIILITVILIL